MSYGQLAVLFLTYVLYSLTHRLSGMESWLAEHKTTIERGTGWKLGDKDATDQLEMRNNSLKLSTKRQYSLFSLFKLDALTE